MLTEYDDISLNLAPLSRALNFDHVVCNDAQALDGFLLVVIPQLRVRNLWIHPGRSKYILYDWCTPEPLGYRRSLPHISNLSRERKNKAKRASSVLRIRPAGFPCQRVEPFSDPPVEDVIVKFAEAAQSFFVCKSFCTESLHMVNRFFGLSSNTTMCIGERFR